MATDPELKGGNTPAAFELKAATFTLPVIRLLAADMDAVAEQLGAKVDQAPRFFHNTPVVIDLSGLPRNVGDVQFPVLVGLLRGYSMIPVGVRGGDAAQNRSAEHMELAILSDAHLRKPRSAASECGVDLVLDGAARPASANGPESDAALPDLQRGTQRQGGVVHERSFKLVTRPVRSGQSVYAAGGDLSVIAPVSAGAELLADGNIHVYGPLRGRAMAGKSGDAAARIFCQELDAELVSVAGHYRVSENIPEALKGAPVQIFLDGEILRIEKL